MNRVVRNVLVGAGIAVLIVILFFTVCTRNEGSGTQRPASTPVATQAVTQ